MSEKEHGLYESNSVESGTYIRAVVVNIVDPLMEGRVAVNIPRLVPDGDPAGAKEINKTTNVNTDVLENSELGDAVSSSVESSNAMWARPLNIHSNDFCVPYLGSTIYVIMEDGDPDKLYYTKYAPTLNGQTIGMDNVKASSDVFTPDKKPLIHVLHEFKDGTTIYHNENSETREFEIKFSSGTSLSISDNATASHIELITKSKYRVIADDTNKLIELSTPAGHKVLVSDGGGGSGEDSKSEGKTSSTKKSSSNEEGDKSESSGGAPNQISATTAGGSSIVMVGDGSNISVTNASGSKVNMAGSDINIANAGGGKVNMAGSTITAEAGGGKVVIGGGSVKIN